ncbi:MAG TPA: hypothetical protein VLL52_24675 [Anaerolineae bacterium]|nr:hypothetical protein [Anaerolineae bacterium]
MFVSNGEQALFDYLLVSWLAETAYEFVTVDDDALGMLVGKYEQIVPIGIHYWGRRRLRLTAGVRVGRVVSGDEEEVRRELAEVCRLFVDVEQFEGLQWVATLLATAGAAPSALGREAYEPRPTLQLTERLYLGYLRKRAAEPKVVAEIVARVGRYQAELARLGIVPAEVFLPLRWGQAAFFALREFELLVMGLPWALWGWVNHVLPFWGTRQLVGRREAAVRQKSLSTFLLVGGLLYVIQAVVIGFILPTFWFVLYLLVWPYCGLLAILYFDRVGSAWRRSRTFWYFRQNSEAQEALMAEGRAIIEMIYALEE